MQHQDDAGTSCHDARRYPPAVNGGSGMHLNNPAETANRICELLQHVYRQERRQFQAAAQARRCSVEALAANAICGMLQDEGLLAGLGGRDDREP